MQVKHVLLSLLILSYSIINYAQRPFYNERPEFLKANSVWPFYDKTGFDFNTHSSITSKATVRIFGVEGCASVADAKTGELLFYSDGQRVYNAKHDIMPNGDNLKGNGSNYDNKGSTTQGACIVPVIDTPGKYYLFSLCGPTNSSRSRYFDSGILFYSIIDMTLDNGWGDVIPGQKNIVLSKDTLGEAMIAVPGDNCDIWLIVHEHINPVYKSYRISKYGIESSPVTSVVGKMPGYQQLNTMTEIGQHGQGGITISPNRQLLSLCSRSFSIDFYSSLGIFLDSGLVPTVQLAKFDPATGRVYDGIGIGELASNAYCCAFSPDNTKLYFYGQERGKGFSIFQYDISKWDSVAIALSKERVGSIFSSRGTPGQAYLRLYNDTIYIFAGVGVNGKLLTINQPNNSGATCLYNGDSVLSIGGSSLPNEVVFSLPADTFYNTVLDTTICPKDELALQGRAGYQSYIWNDGSTDIVNVIKEQGIYWVTQNDGCHSYIDTFIVHFSDLEKPVITVNVLELSTTRRYDTYQWLLNGRVIPEANQRFFNVHENGDYQVVVSNSSCTDTSDIYKVTNARNTKIEKNNSLTHQISIYPNPTDDAINIISPADVYVALYSIEGKEMKVAQKEKLIYIKGVPEGMYFLHIYDLNSRLLKIQKIIKY